MNITDNLLISLHDILKQDGTMQQPLAADYVVDRLRVLMESYDADVQTLDALVIYGLHLLDDPEQMTRMTNSSSFLAVRAGIGCGLLGLISKFPGVVRWNQALSDEEKDWLRKTLLKGAGWRDLMWAIGVLTLVGLVTNYGETPPVWDARKELVVPQ